MEDTILLFWLAAYQDDILRDHSKSQVKAAPTNSSSMLYLVLKYCISLAVHHGIAIFKKRPSDDALQAQYTEKNFHPF